jgi:outer membrane protein TolC
VLGLLGIRVPLFYATKQRNGVKEARSTLQGSKRDYQTVLQDIRFRVKDHVVRAQRAARLVKLIGTAIIPQASLALESSIAGYSVGNVNFLTMLDNLLNLQQDELDLHRERTEHEIAIARLEEIVGVPLQESTQ